MISVFLSHFGAFLRSQLKFLSCLFNHHLLSQRFVGSAHLAGPERLLILTLSVAHVVSVKMHDAVSLLNRPTTKTSQHCSSHYMQKCWACCHNLSVMFYTFKCVLNWWLGLRLILTFTYDWECVKNQLNQWSTRSLQQLPWTFSW